MVVSLPLFARATEDNFDEAAYLNANPDLAPAVSDGSLESGLAHFRAFGHVEERWLKAPDSRIGPLRAEKMGRLRPFLREDMPHEWLDGKVDYLTENLRAETRIVATDAVSSNDYDGSSLKLIGDNPDGLLLDCGAGSRGVYYENVVNYEIVNYPSTDVLGVGEELPFKSDSFDAVISSAVLEHVRDPFRCAKEISRVLKSGGKLYCSIPFLQPYHGYPHHYFNATAQGISRLFEEDLNVLDIDVIASTHPVHALHWILGSWGAGLSSEVRSDFEAMTVKDFLRSPMSYVGEPFCTELSKEKKLELACATVMHAVKP